MRWKNDRGMTRATALLLVGIALLLALLAVPTLRRYKARTAEKACALALASAQRKVDETAVGRELTEEEARQAATQGIVPFEELCPSGGDCYLVPDKDGTFTIVCALHCEDKKLRTRLNAANALEQLERELKTRRLLGEVPQSVTLTLNGAAVVAARTGGDPSFTRGTAATPGYDGTVVLYLADADGLRGVFYADESHCANWRENDGWMGDSLS